MTTELEGLQSALKAILEIADKGDWERIVEIRPETLIAEASGRTPAPALESLIATRQMLQQAMTLCQQRIEDITPLLEALSSKAANKP